MKFAIIHNNNSLFGIFDDVMSAKARKEYLSSINIKDIKIYQFIEVK